MSFTGYVPTLLACGVSRRRTGRYARLRKLDDGRGATEPRCYPGNSYPDNGHDRTFFFLNFEQLRGPDIVSNTPLTVPTNAYRAGDFSGALGRNLGTDVLGRPIIENTIYDPATERTVSEMWFGVLFPETRSRFHGRIRLR
jgi:hypothetical protein